MRWLLAFFLIVALLPECCSQQLNYYFGNIHSHTGFSDGNKDSAMSGVSKPDGSFTYARLSDNFHFLGISEHNHYSSSHNPGFRRPLYQQGLDMAEEANDDGFFVALFGMEYGVSSQYNGHVLVYGMDKLLGWENSVPGLTGVNYDIFNDKTDYRGLFKKVNATPGAFCYLAHPSFDDYSTDGSWNTTIANAPYNISFDSAIVGMPLRSGLATHNGASYSDYPLGHYFNFFKKMLYNGYHLGIGYDHDNHYTNFGRGNGGRLVILAPDLSRASFFQAMRDMRFYGSDDMNARISFSCNGAVMGRITSGNDYPTITVSHQDPDGEEADTIKIWKGTKNSGGLWAEIVHGALQNNTAVFTDTDVTAGKEYYYFAEIRQKDGQWMVTSPVWYTPQAPLQIRSYQSASANVLYDPVHRQLHISLNRDGDYSVTLNDAQGRRAHVAGFRGASYVADLAMLQDGLYVLMLRDGRTEISRKVLVR